jgi:hypothetical protein
MSENDMSDHEVIENTPDPLRLTKDGGLETGRNFDVLASSLLDAVAVLERVKGITRGSVWRSSQGELYDLTTIAQDIEVEPDPEAPIDGKGRYFVHVPYSQGDGSGQGGENDEPIPGGPPIYTVEGSIKSGPVDLDANGNPIVNSVDEPPESPLSKNQVDEALRVRWWHQGDRNSVQKEIRKYRGALSDEAWQGAIAGSFFCRKFTIRDQIKGGWLKLDATFDYRDPIDPDQINATLYLRQPDNSLSQVTNPIHGWHDNYANRGRRLKNGVKDGKQQYKPIRQEGEPIDEPVPINKEGTAQLDATAAPVAIVVPLYSKKAKFSDWGI